MKYKNILRIVLIFLLLFSGKSFSQDCKATLKINTDITNSGVYLNNDLVGNGNIIVDLKPGEYYLKIIESGNVWNPRELSDTIIINNCDETERTYSFNSLVYLKTIPQDVYIYENDSLIGHTPMFIKQDFERLSLSKPGFESRQIYPEELSMNNIINLNYIGEINGKSFYEKNIFKILVGSIVVLGGTTAYFKLKADDEFDKYQQTGESSFLDQTRKYDLISGIAMGALQINFGILIYYFLTD